MLRRSAILVAISLLSFCALAQSPGPIAIRAGRLIDGKNDQVISNAQVDLDRYRICNTLKIPLSDLLSIW
jgi:hypothetical protein